MEIEQGEAPQKPRHVKGENEKMGKGENGKMRKGDRNSALFLTDPVHSCNPFLICVIFLNEKLEI